MQRCLGRGPKPQPAIVNKVAGREVGRGPTATVNKFRTFHFTKRPSGGHTSYSLTLINNQQMPEAYSGSQWVIPDTTEISMDHGLSTCHKVCTSMATVLMLPVLYLYSM